MKALTIALVDWVTRGTEPPPSRYPRLDRGELVPATKAAMNFPAIPGAPSPDGVVNMVADHDYGPEFHYADLSGVITKEPPVVKQLIPTLAPKVDADGSDVGGVPSVLHQAPLGSYLGWNPTASGFDKGKQCTLNGGYIPFAGTKAERMASGDPRLSLEERYGSHAGGAADDIAEAPMPGVVIAVNVTEGQAVSAGETLLVIESMKLETAIKAWRDGAVAAVHVGVGQSFQRGALLLTLASQ